MIKKARFFEVQLVLFPEMINLLNGSMKKEDNRTDN